MIMYVCMYVCMYVYMYVCMYVCMRVLSPDACGATQDINASTHAQSVTGQECSNDHKARELCNIENEHSLALPTECSTTPK